MEVTEGLLDHMVLQRNRRGASDARFSGRCEAKGTLVARVRAAGRTLKGFARLPVGRAVRGRFVGRLKGLPASGPYDIELRVLGPAGGALEAVAVEDVLVGDVWVLGGQSNMQGVGLLKDRLEPLARVRAFYLDDRWAPAEDPIHNMHAALDPVHLELAGGVQPEPATITGVGPGVAFAQDMFSVTGVPQGLIPCAHGGTSMAQWDPKLKGRGGRSLYGAMLRRLRKNGSKVAGVVWYQGESDAVPESAPLYTRRMKALVRAMRRDFGQPKLPVALVQIGRVVQWAWPAQWDSVREQQRRLPESLDKVTVVPAIDLDLSDGIHVSACGQHRLGRRLARAMRELKTGRRAGKPPLELKSLAVRSRCRDGLADLVVEFANVEGGLRAGGRPAGFVLCGPEPARPFYGVDLDGPRAVIHTVLSVPDLECMQIQYGRGCDPYCNLTDEADRAVPAFGPVPVGVPRAISPFVREFLVSPFVPADATLTALDFPGPLDSLPLEPRVFPDRFCARADEVRSTRGREGVFYYGCRVRCPHRMQLKALLGYDGPVKVWLDGLERFHDPAGTNPASPVDAEVSLGAVAGGEHELLVALGNNGGNAWGIFLRLERADLGPSRVRRGPDAYAMPAVFI